MTKHEHHTTLCRENSLLFHYVVVTNVFSIFHVSSGSSNETTEEWSCSDGISEKETCLESTSKANDWQIYWIQHEYECWNCLLLPKLHLLAPMDAVTTKIRKKWAKRLTMPVQHVFGEVWLKDLSWLLFYKSMKIITCVFCATNLEFAGTTDFVKGYWNFEHETIIIHKVPGTDTVETKCYSKRCLKCLS